MAETLTAGPRAPGTASRITTTEPSRTTADEGLMYFRFPNGRVVPADGSPMEMLKKMERDIEPLRRYGQHGSNAYYVDHPYEPLFQAGGARELSVDHIMEMGYHVRPPLLPTCGRHVGTSDGQHNHHTDACFANARPVEFPQLEGLDLPGEQECPDCGNLLNTPKALKQHREVMHSEKRQQQAVADGIVAGMQAAGVGQSMSPEAIAAIVAATVQALNADKPAPMGARRDR